MSDTTELLPESTAAAGEGATPGAEGGSGGSTSADATTSGVSGGSTARRRRGGEGLPGMLLQELQGLAASLGIPGTARMRKSQLVSAIQAVQNGQSAAAGPAAAGSSAAANDDAAAAVAPQPTATEPAAAQPAAAQPAAAQPAPDQSDAITKGSAPADASASTSSDTAAGDGGAQRRRRRSSRGAGSAVSDNDRPGDGAAPAADEDPARIEAGPVAGAEAAAPSEVRPEGEQKRRRDRDQQQRDGRDQQQRDGRDQQQRDGRDQQQREGREQRDGRNQQRDGRNDRQQGQNQGNQNQQGQNQQGQNQRQDAGDESDDDFGGRNRRGRFRDRQRGRNKGQGGFNDAEPVIREDDVLVPIAGILDILDNYAFVRTSGYLTGPNDVYVSLGQVRRYGLRRGDAVTGAVKAPQDGNDGQGGGGGNNRREKYNALVRLDSVNGISADEAKNRAEFHKLTPLYPNERLRLETDPNVLTTRVIDLVMPIGKGQRALIVSPPKAGKTMVLQSIANAITTNNPECHLMVVLVDERPEEVTDMQRSVKGEVIASTFDRPPSDHTSVAELSIERAKRLVEMGHDVVVLLDSITRLGRAYNLAAPASGRILSGGVDSTALYPPKRFLGAARNIEHGGSLTILATALVETGSTMDTVIFEEFKGTGNAELRLDRRIADKRIFPAVDVDASGTRKEEILLGHDELAVVYKLRRVLHALEPLQAIELLMDRLRKTTTNYEFLMQIAKTTPGE